MATATLTRVGIVTTGQSPRHEYRSFHRNALKALGVSVEVVERATLDGLTRDEIRAIEIDPAEGPGIGCYVHTNDSTDVRMGGGWEEVFVRQDEYLRRAQTAVDELEAQGVALTMMCCAERYPPGAFRTKQPLLLPYRLMFGLVRDLVETLGSVRLALLIPTAWHIAQDRETWSSEPWMANVEVGIGVGIPSYAGVRELEGRDWDLTLIWGYGDGLAPNDPPDMLDEIARRLGAPVVTPNILNVQAARLLLKPPQPERLHVGQS